jgi:hypothetical protein
VALNTAGRTESSSARGFDPVVVARALSPQASPPTALPLSAVASATLRVTASGWDFETARGTGQVALQPGTGPGLKPTGAAAVRIQGRSLAIADAHVEARGARVTADGELRRDRSVSGRWIAEVPLAAVPELIVDVRRSVKTPELSGRLRVEGEIKGKTSAPEVAARLRSEDLAVHGNPVGLEAEALYRDGRRPSLRACCGRRGRRRSRAGAAPADGRVGSRGRVDSPTSLRRSTSRPGEWPATGTLAVADPRRAAHARPLRADCGGPGCRGRTASCSGRRPERGRRVETQLEAQLAGGRAAGTAR